MIDLRRYFTALRLQYPAVRWRIAARTADITIFSGQFGKITIELQFPLIGKYKVGHYIDARPTTFRDFRTIDQMLRAVASELQIATKRTITS